ncbi:MAG: lipoyl(octanoyl) transferase LipB [Nevskiales bacterium]
MRTFTDTRAADTPDEFWCLEHSPVFTQGQRGRSEHVLATGDIPVVATDRGGQITYHGPGQLVLYPLLDLTRLGLGPRGLVKRLEQAMVSCLASYGIEAAAKAGAPGVYVNEAKIGSIGLRIRRGCSYHGLSLNVAMDLSPFARINPCGFQGLAMTQISALGGPDDPQRVAQDLLPALARNLELELAETAPA